MAHVRQLAGVIGSRASTTEGMTRAADYIAAQLRSYGYQVSPQPFTMSVFENRETLLQVQAPGQQSLPVNPLHYSRVGQVTAPLVDGGLGRKEDFQGGSFAGKVVLVKRGGMLLSEKAANAAAAGATAVIIYNNRPGPFYGTLLEQNGNPIVVSVSDDDGERLLSSLRKGPVVVRVKVDAITEQAEAVNVVARWPREAGRTILLGAHYDSVPVGPGANDNASGVAVVLELARVLAARGLGEQVVVVAFAGEEQGLIGSRAYVDRLSPAERDRIAAMLNLDMVGQGKELRIASGGGAQAERYAKLAAEIAAANGIPARTATAGADSDHWPFAEQGIPVLFFDTGIDPYYHTSEDTIDKLEPATVKSSGLVALGVAQRILTGR
jgi:aminopeptidase YwaD